jgi:hypothetical protein
MQPAPTRQSDDDMNSEKPSEDTFSEAADLEANSENLACGTEASPIKRYSYSKPV